MGSLEVAALARELLAARSMDLPAALDAALGRAGTEMMDAVNEDAGAGGEFIGCLLVHLCDLAIRAGEVADERAPRLEPGSTLNSVIRDAREPWPHVLSNHSGVTLVNAEDAAREAVAFWTRQLGTVTDELQSWLEERIGDVHLLWGDIHRLNRSKDMWGELTKVLEARDPTNPWTRNYDNMYFEAQVLRLTRVFSGQVSLVTILNDFERRPELCRALTARLTPESLRDPVSPGADRTRLGRLLSPLDVWRNKRIAHIDRERTLSDIYLHDLNEMVDGTSEVFGQYAMRLTGSAYQVTFPDEPPWTNWKKAFTVPIFDD